MTAKGREGKLTDGTLKKARRFKQIYNNENKKENTQYAFTMPDCCN